MLLKPDSLLWGCPEEAAAFPRQDGGARNRPLSRMGRQRRHGCDALIRLEPLDRPGLRGGRGGSGVPPRKPHGSYAGLIRHHHVQRRERVLALAGEAASSGPTNGLGMAREEAHLQILFSAQRSELPTPSCVLAAQLAALAMPGPTTGRAALCGRPPSCSACSRTPHGAPSLVVSPLCAASCRGAPIRRAALSAARTPRGATASAYL